MKVLIRNANGAIPVEGLKPSDFVASLKSRYIASDGFVGNPTFVSLIYKGMVLDDMHRLMDYGLHNGDTIAHVSSSEALKLLVKPRGGAATHAERHKHGHGLKHLASGGAGGESEPSIPMPSIDYPSLARQLESLSSSRPDVVYGDEEEAGPTVEGQAQGTDVRGGLEGGRATQQGGRMATSPPSTFAPMSLRGLLYGDGGPATGYTGTPGMGMGRARPGEGQEGEDPVVPVLVGREGGENSVVLMPLSEVRELLGETTTAGQGNMGMGTRATPGRPTPVRRPTTATMGATGMPTSPSGLRSSESEDTSGPSLGPSMGMAMGMGMGSELPSGFHEPGIAPGARAELARLRAARRAREALIPVNLPETSYVVPYGSIFAEDGGMPMGGHGQEYYGRARRGATRSHAMVSEVRTGPAGHAFRALHRMEGRWSGDAEMLLFTHSPASAAAAAGTGAGTGEAPGHTSAGLLRVVSSTLTWDDKAGCWHESSTITTPDGLSSAQGLALVPIADGVCRVELAGVREGPGHHGHVNLVAGAGLGGGLGHLSTSGDLDIRLREVHGPEGGQAGTTAAAGTSILMLTAHSRSTGLPVLIETIVLTGHDMRRVRTVQRFSSDGSLAAVYTVREARVLDTLTGALEVRMGAGTAKAKGSPTPARGGLAGDLDDHGDEDVLLQEVEGLYGRDPRVAAMIRRHLARRAQSQDQHKGWGRRSPLPGLSPEASPTIEIDLSGLPLEGAVPLGQGSGMTPVVQAMAGIAAAVASVAAQEQEQAAGRAEW